MVTVNSEWHGFWSWVSMGMGTSTDSHTHEPRLSKMVKN
jgi:hypothetical protein